MTRLRDTERDLKLQDLSRSRGLTDLSLICKVGHYLYIHSSKCDLLSGWCPSQLPGPPGEVQPVPPVSLPPVLPTEERQSDGVSRSATQAGGKDSWLAGSSSKEFIAGGAVQHRA